MGLDTSFGIAAPDVTRVVTLVGVDTDVSPVMGGEPVLIEGHELHAPLVMNLLGIRS